MDFRRNGLRDERRRRVLIDETLHGTHSSDSDGTANADPKDGVRNPVKPYTDAAVASSQLPVTAILPKRPFITWTVWLVGGLLIAGIELLYHSAYLRAPEELRLSLLALDVEARGSLASWFAALVLGVSSFGSLLIYQIRRHRTDDYRGRYRWWLWLVPLLMVLSLNAATGLHEALSGVLTSVTGAAVAVEGKGWWMLAYGAVFFPIVLQLLIELWPSRLATFFLVTTISAYLAAGLFELEALQLADPAATTVCHSAILLAAHLGVLVTVLSYGRYVFLDAHGRLAPRRTWVRWPRWKPSRKKGKVKSPAKARAAKQVRVDNAHARFGQEKAAPPTVTLQSQTDYQEDYDSEEEDGGDDGRKLSKSERRRLRKTSQRLQRG